MKNNKGFTLIELLVTIVILGIVLSITTVAVRKIQVKQEEKNLKNVISSILTGAKLYDTDMPFDNVEGPTVQKLLDGNYVNFDTEKYGFLNNITVSKQICQNSKSKMVIKVTLPENILKNFKKGIDDNYPEILEYNDCGCFLYSDTGTNKVFSGKDGLCEEKND